MSSIQSNRHVSNNRMQNAIMRPRARYVNRITRKKERKAMQGTPTVRHCWGRFGLIENP